MRWSEHSRGRGRARCRGRRARSRHARPRCRVAPLRARHRHTARQLPRTQSARSASRSRSSCTRPGLCGQTAVDRFNEHVTTVARLRVDAVVVARRLRRPHLVERHLLLHHVEHAVANDGHHVPVVTDIGLVAEPAVAGHNHRPALFVEVGDRELEDVVDACEQSLDAAAARKVNHRVAVGCKHITRADDVAAPEEHHRVAVGVSSLDVQQLHRLAVHEQVLLLDEVGVGRQRVDGSLASGQAVQQVLVRKDRSTARPGDCGRPGVPAGKCLT